MMQPGLYHLLFISATLFFTGMYGFFTRRNLVTMLMSVELILNSVNLNFIAFKNRMAITTPTGVSGARWHVARWRGACAAGARSRRSTRAGRDMGASPKEGGGDERAMITCGTPGRTTPRSCSGRRASF